jgi:hypothetical protein
VYYKIGDFVTAVYGLRERAPLHHCALYEKVRVRKKEEMVRKGVIGCAAASALW